MKCIKFIENTLADENNKYSALCSRIKNRHIGLIASEKIMYCEAYGSYTWIYLVSGEKIKVSYRLSIVAEKLSSITFIRCHKSFLINMKYIVDYSNKIPYTLTLNNRANIPIAANKRAGLIEQVFHLILK